MRYSIVRCLLILACFIATSEAFGGGGVKAAPKKVAKSPAKKVVKKAPVKKVAAKKVVKKAPVKKAPVKKAPVKKAPVKKAVVRSMGTPETDIGVTPPLGPSTPNFLSRGPDAYRRYQEIEIKHGRLAMAATLGVIVTEAGIKFPGYISFSQDLKFSDVPGSLDGAYTGIPLAGWAQIAALVAASTLPSSARTRRCRPVTSCRTCRRRG